MARMRETLAGAFAGASIPLDQHAVMARRYDRDQRVAAEVGSEHAFALLLSRRANVGVERYKPTV
jgi:hypothetical protein